MPIGPVTLISYSNVDTVRPDPTTNPEGLTEQEISDANAALASTNRDGQPPAPAQPLPWQTTPIQSPNGNRIDQPFYLASGDIGHGAFQDSFIDSAKKFYQYLQTHSPQQILNDINSELFKLYTSGLSAQALMKWGPAWAKQSFDFVLSQLSKLPGAIREPMWNLFSSISQRIQSLAAMGPSAAAQLQKVVGSVLPAAQKVLAVLRSPAVLGAGTFLYTWGWILSESAGECDILENLRGHYDNTPDMSRFWNDLEKQIAEHGGDPTYVAEQRRAINDLISLGQLGTAKSLFQGVLLNLIAAGYMPAGFDVKELANSVIDGYAQRVQSAK